MNARPETVAWLTRYYELLDHNRVGDFICELEVTYIKHGWSSITLPGSLFARVADGRFIEQRVYIDQGPLLA